MKDGYRRAEAGGRMAGGRCRGARLGGRRVEGRRPVVGGSEGGKAEGGTRLPCGSGQAQFIGMSTLAKKPVTKKAAVRKPTVRRLAAKKLTPEQEILALVGTRTPPPAKSTTVDLLRSLRDGSFDKAAAKVDWDIVETVVKNRRSSASLRAVQK